MALLGQTGVLNHRHRRAGRHACAQQRVLRLRHRRHAHVDHQRGAAVRQRTPVGCVAVLGMARHQRHPHGHPTHRQRKAARSGRRCASCHAIDHLAGHATSVQPQRLFAGTAEHTRIAALQAHHALALPGKPPHQPLDERLRGGSATPAFSNPDCARLRAMAQDFRIDEVIHQHHFRLAQHPHRLERQKLRVARSGAHQPHLAGSACDRRSAHVEMQQISRHGQPSVSNNLNQRPQRATQGERQSSAKALPKPQRVPLAQRLAYRPQRRWLAQALHEL